jgi:hypothetical protein
MQKLKPPAYSGNSSAGVGLAVESMKRHTPTDEGWQLFSSLEANGYTLAGNNLAINERDVGKILDITNPGVVVLQDRREWDVKQGEFREIADRFENVTALKGRDDIFKLTILKDAHQNPDYQREAAENINCHAWIIYYDPATVHRFAPFTRPEHLIRTYHTIDADAVPAYSAADRKGCILSGAVSQVYPLRMRLARQAMGKLLPDTTYLKHPGYSVNGCHTPDFLRVLSRFKVSICTASDFQYTLRKFPESTAAGCIVVTNLVEKMPEIDGNFVRIRSDIPLAELQELLLELYETYNPDKQEFYAKKAIDYYDYRQMGRRLTADIEAMRQDYNGGRDAI